MRIPTPLGTGLAAVTAAALAATFVPAAATAVSGGTAAAPTASVAAGSDARPAGELSSSVRGEFGRNGTVRGRFDPERFIVKKGQVYADGVLHATLRRGNGELVGNKSKQILIPVASGTVSPARGQSCDILNLVLGPLDLNLLGLEVHLNRVVLDIVATPGAGNLLGNLLCAVAGLLDDTQLSALERLRLANLLNRILGLL